MLACVCVYHAVFNAENGFYDVLGFTIAGAPANMCDNCPAQLFLNVLYHYFTMQ